MTKRKTFPNLSNPPAIEAVLDITTNEISDTKKLDYKKREFKSKFPRKEQILLFETSFHEAQQRTQIINKNRHLGFAYKSEDEKEISQFRLNGFSYSRLSPYLGWDAFIEKALENWVTYRSIRKKLEIKRIGLRFINIIRVPDGDPVMPEYFNVGITSETGLGKIKQYKYQYIRDFDDGLIAIVNFGQTEIRDNEISFVFDIDVIQQASTNTLNADGIASYLTAMREAKNTIFFENLTEKALEPYK